MAQDQLTPKQLTRAVVRFNTITMGIVLGLICGVGLFAATAWLLLKGGPAPGPHLALLAQYFPGYAVSWGGSLLGLLYGFATGFIAGAVVGSVYNKLAR
ncbi:MAG TPA: hypothetical protein VLR94_09880 [Acidobacteriota bacterium]|nr:hypothetical protein [Acidobacteriota bacterium]